MSVCQDPQMASMAHCTGTYCAWHVASLWNCTMHSGSTLVSRSSEFLITRHIVHACEFHGKERLTACAVSLSAMCHASCVMILTHTHKLIFFLFSEIYIFFDDIIYDVFILVLRFGRNVQHIIYDVFVEDV